MGNIIHYLVVYNQYLLQIIFDLLTFIARYIPLKQKIHDDSKSPKYQKFKVDRLPIIKRYEKVDWQFLQEYYSDGFDFERYEGVAGIIQQYLFYYIRGLDE